MQSEVLTDRLAGIQQALMGIYSSGAGMSSCSKGNERELFINLFLKEVFPPGFRFGSGDALDSNGNKSGQLDVVVEFLFVPSVPTLVSGPRLYLAEGVAAVVEVKSNVASQWEEVVSTANELSKLERMFQPPGFTPYGPPSPRIPIFAVGYKGWKTMEKVKEKANSGIVDGVLVIEEGLFSTSNEYHNGMFAQGAISLWGLISALHIANTCVLANSFSPLKYTDLFDNNVNSEV